MVDSDIYEKLVNKYGKEHQLYVIVEEMAEAIASITQYLNRGRDVEDMAIDELADVCIMLKQCEVIYGDRLINAIYKKLEKAKQYL